VATKLQERGLDIHLQSPVQQREYELLADRIAGTAPGRVLDWGCGYGQVTALLHRRGVDVRGFDYRPHESGVGSDRLERFPEIEVSYSPEPTALPFDDGSFDAVLSCGVLEHVQSPEGSLAELHRILRPGGRLYVIKLPNRSSYLEWIAKRLGMYYHGKLEHDTLWTTRSARDTVARCGFEVQDVRLANMLPLTLDHALMARAEQPVWWLNQALARVPGLNRLATNVEVDAVRA
jgi:SAM-dependent methyltransferase